MGDMSREPSMEDILSSIRKVIARDEAPGERRAPRADPPPRAQDVDTDDILDLRKQVFVETESDLSDPQDHPQSQEEELVSDESAAAARQSLEALSAVMAAPPASTSPAGGARSIEDVVVDALRPMLKEWLDAHLPQMVEAMVAKEIARIVGRSGEA